MSSLAVVVPYWEFSGFNATRRSYLGWVTDFLETSDVHFIIVSNVDIDHPNNLVVEADPLWQKERLINVGFDALSEDYVMSLDADCVIQEYGWADKIIEYMKESNHIAAQVCSHYNNSMSSVYEFLETGKVNLNCMDGAWVFKRGTRLFDKCIVGGGDTVLSCQILGKDALWSTGFRNYAPEMKEELVSYDLNGTIGCVGLHGTSYPHPGDRRYFDRHALLKLFMPWDIEHRGEGWMWRETAPASMKAAVEAYIRSR